MDNKQQPQEASAQTALPNQYDDQITAAINSVQPPVWLKDSILKEAPQAKAAILRPRFKLMAIAAMLAVGFLTSFIYFKLLGNDQLNHASNFRDAAASYISDERFLLDLNSSSLTEIANWIKERNAPNFGELPAALLAENPIGCKELKWRDQTITLVCFHREDGTIAHLFIGNQNPEMRDLMADITQVMRVSDLETAGWSTEQQVYLLMGSDPSVNIQQYLQAS
ncbi:MAG: hypothetical protein ACSHYA_14580 [Opitutaceae bacterium]